MDIETSMAAIDHQEPSLMTLRAGDAIMPDGCTSTVCAPGS